MKVFAPKYYSQFKCIASKCSHSCCIGWEIDVDEKSLDKYNNSNFSYAKEICKSINSAGAPHFKLQPNGRCYHLDKNGLCKIITNLGENYLCDICREHPRFYNQTPYGLEVGLGLSCEEAARIILSSDDYFNFYEVEEDNLPTEKFDFNPIPLRNQILTSLQRKNSSYEEKLKALTINFNVSTNVLSDEDWKDLLDSLEYLNEDNKKLFACYTSTATPSKETQSFIERLLAYFVYRHVTKAQSKYEACQYFGICLFLEKLACSIIESKGVNSLEELIPIAITISEEIEYNEDNVEQILFEFI